MTTNLSHTEKQDIAVLLLCEIERLKTSLSKLPKKPRKISTLDKLTSYPNLIQRHEQTLAKISSL